jgi:hypothetical protein
MNWNRPFAEKILTLSSGAHYTITAGLIILFALAIRMVGLSKGIWMDEFRSIEIMSSSPLIAALRNYDHPPLYFLLLRAWNLISQGEAFLRVLSVIFGVGTVAAVINWVKGYSRTGSLMAGLLVSSLPMMLRFSQEIRHYSMLLFFAALSYLFASHIKRTPNRKCTYIWLSVTLAICMLTHSLGMLIMVCVSAFVIIDRTFWSSGRVRAFLLVLIIPSLTFLFINFIFKETFFKDPATFWIPKLSLPYLLGHLKIVFGLDILLAIKSRIVAYCPPFHCIAVYGINALLLIFCGLLLIFGQWKKTYIFLVPATLHVLVLVIISLLLLPTIWYRTLLPILIPLIAFMGVHIRSISYKKIRYPCIAAVVVISALFVFNWVTVQANLPYEDWKKVAQVLKQNLKAGDVLLIYPHYAGGPLGYYLDITVYDSLGLKHGDGPDRIKRFLQSLASPSSGRKKSLCLVVRKGLLVKKYIQNYNERIRFLENRCGKSVVKKMGIIWIFRFGCD